MLESLIFELKICTMDRSVRVTFMKKELWFHVPTSGHEEYIVKFDHEGRITLCTEFTKDEIDYCYINDISKVMMTLEEYQERLIDFIKEGDNYGKIS